MFAFLKRRAFLIVLGFVLLALFIWYAGPYFAFAEYRPLESETARLIAIALVVGCWAAALLIRRLRAMRANDRLLAAVVKPTRAEPERPSADIVQLRERFEEAVATLKQAPRGGHSLYELPWYVIIGAPGSGKTTALLNSGLNFPLEQRMGKGALRGVGGTRNCEWWFTDQAVFLDTAGRYTTQDSDTNGDSAAWTEFLALLRKYRKRRPVNGVILAISAHDLMVQGESSREAHVAAARRRLSELNRELRIQVPVYLMVTKCDLVAGFTEYFDDLTHDGRAQVWGVTWPYEQTLSGESAQAASVEFDALMTRLNARLFGRLEEERDVRRRTKVFAFPQQMAALRDLLTQFVTEVFAPTRFDRQRTLLRGIYFTSGTQEGTPIDRLLGAIGRRFAIAPEAVSSGGRGKAYFIERLLKHVLIAESGLAGVNRRVEVQKAAVQLAAYAAMALITVLGVIVWSVSYSRNRAYLEDVAADVVTLQKAPPVASSSLATLVPRLDAVRAVVESADRYPDGAPWGMRWGLYQGTSITNSARDAYTRELDSALLLRVAERFRQRLIDYAPEPEKLYAYLKAYLMLGQPQYLDKTELGLLVDLEWKDGNSADPDAGASLAKHFRSLLESRDTLRPIALDETLVAQARSTIRQASIPRLIYRHLQLTYASDPRVVRLDVAAGLNAQQVFRRKSGTSLAQPVPAIYTRQVFDEVTGQDIEGLAKDFYADRWVWGDSGVPDTSSTTLMMQVIDIYEKDYIAAWDAILNDISPVPFTDFGATADVLATLAAPTSPLRGLLKTVDDHTFLVKPPDPGDQTGAVAVARKKLEQRYAKIFGDKGTRAQPGSQVTAHFDPIHRLLAGAPGSAPIDRTLALIGEMRQLLASVGAAAGLTRPNDPGTQSRVSVLAKSMRQEASTMPAVVGAVAGQIAQGAEALAKAGAGNELANLYNAVQRQCEAAFSGRYPFVSTSTEDVLIDDFGRLLGYNGVFESFFKSHLEPYVDTARSPWTWRPDPPAGVSTAMLRQFEAAQRIRETFFRPGNQRPELQFSVTPLFLDAAATRFILEIDGQPIDYRHGPEQLRSANWPGPKPGEAAVTFEESSGRRPNKVSKGAWAWFRLIDSANVQRETDARHVLGFEIAGHQARVRIEAGSIRNPFATRDVQNFRCGLGST